MGRKKMAKIFVYTKKYDQQFYQSEHPDNYAGTPDKAYNCDVDDAMHIAVQLDGGEFVPMRNNTGVLFPTAEFPDGAVGGKTKTLIDPWVFRTAEGAFGVIAVRRGQGDVDPESVGSAMLFFSSDMIRFCEADFIKLSDYDVRHPKCVYDGEKYLVEWEADGKIYCGETKCFCDVSNVKEIEKSAFENASEGLVPDAVPGNILEITDAEAEKIVGYLGKIENVGVSEAVIKVPAGDKISPDILSALSKSLP